MTHIEKCIILDKRREDHARAMALHCVQYRFCRERGRWFRYDRDTGRELGEGTPPQAWSMS